MKATVRMIRPDDMEKIGAMMTEQGYEVPELTDSTLVAEDEEGRIVAFAAVRGIPWLYLYFDETEAGRREGVRVLKTAEDMMRTQFTGAYIVGVDPKEDKMRELAEKFGFENQGELIYLRKLGDVLRYA